MKENYYLDFVDKHISSHYTRIATNLKIFNKDIGKCPEIPSKI